MWTALGKGGLALAILSFMMWALRKILNPITDMATSGPHADAESVQRIGGYFAALTTENLVLLVGIGIGIYLLSRAAVERSLAR